MTAIGLPIRWHPSRTFAWGFVAQSLSSATSLSLTLMSGRLLGPAGLGVIFIGFSSYLVVLGLLRALVVDPMIASSSGQGARERAGVDRFAFTVVGFLACIGSAALLGIGSIESTDLLRGLLLFGPWIVPALVEDFLRSVLFRDGKEHVAAVLEALWLATFLCLVPVVRWIRTDWAVVGSWGVGALVAAVVGLTIVRLRPQLPSATLRWWRVSVSSLGRWLLGASVISIVSSYGAVMLLALVLGATELGALRAVLSAMTPLSLIIPAISLPGLPALARASTRSGLEARKLAWQLGMAAGLIAVGYVLVFGLAPGLLELLFGDEFAGYASLVWPLGLGQATAALAIGFVILLKAEQRGREFFATRSLVSLASLLCPILLALSYGLDGAAWGTGIASAAGALLTIAVARGRHARRPFSDHSQNPVPRQSR